MNIRSEKTLHDGSGGSAAKVTQTGEPEAAGGFLVEQDLN